MRTFIVEGRNGKYFLVRIVAMGERYGQDNEHLHADEVPLVEFYDTRWPIHRAPDGSVLGQFIERHKLTALDRKGGRKVRRTAFGATLHVSRYLHWAIAPCGRRSILAFLRQQLPEDLPAPPCATAPEPPPRARPAVIPVVEPALVD